MTLTEELQEISGIGPKKAEEIEAIVEEHDETGPPFEDLDEAVEHVEEALGYLDEDRPGYARKFLERVVE